MSSHRRCCCNAVGCCDSGSACGITLDGSGQEVAPTFEVDVTMTSASTCSPASICASQNSCNHYSQQTISLQGTFQANGGVGPFCAESSIFEEVTEEFQDLHGNTCEKKIQVLASHTNEVSAPFGPGRLYQVLVFGRVGHSCNIFDLHRGYSSPTGSEFNLNPGATWPPPDGNYPSAFCGNVTISSRTLSWQWSGQCPDEYTLSSSYILTQHLSGGTSTGIHSLSATVRFLGLTPCPGQAQQAMAGGGGGVSSSLVQPSDTELSPEAFTVIRQGRGIDPRIAALTPEANAPRGCCG